MLTEHTSTSAFMRYLHKIVGQPGARKLPDAEALARFVADGDGAAFETLVERHGPMVFGVCRRMLPNVHDAEDAFQATFLVLARKAAAIGRRDLLANWLYGVAYRVALKARSQCSRWPAPVTEVPDMVDPGTASTLAEQNELNALLDDELNRLPRKYRMPVVLCYLEGKTNDEAARELGWPKGTLSGRLARARDILRARLSRRGLAQSGAMFATLLTQAPTPTPVSGLVASATVQAATQFAWGTAGSAATVSPKVLALAEGVIKAMFLGKLKIISATLVALSIFGVAVGWCTRHLLASRPAVALGAEPSDPKPQPPQALPASAGKQEKLEPGGRQSGPLPAGAIARIGSVHLHQQDNSRDKVAFSPTGKLLASAAGDRIKLWDASTGNLLREMKGHGEFGMIESLSFSPDGRKLASGGADWTCRIWDVETGKQLQLLRAHRFGQMGNVYPTFAAFTADGATLVSGGHEGVIQMWDVATGRELLKLDPEVGKSPEERERELIRAIAVTRDGKKVAVANGVKVRLWDLASGEPAEEIAQEAAWVPHLKFTPGDGSLVWCTVGASEKNPVEGVRIWDLADGKPGVTLAAHKGIAAYSFDISRDGTRLASGCGDATVRLWDLKSGEQLRVIRGLKGTPWSVSFSPDGRTVASAGSGAIQLWNTETGEELLADPQGHWGAVNALGVTSNGKSMLLAGRDRVIRICDLASGQVERSFVFESKDYSQEVAFSPDGSAAAVSYGTTVDVWDVATGERRWSRDEMRESDAIPEIKKPQPHALAFSPDGKLLVSWTSTDLGMQPYKNFPMQKFGAVFRVWDAATGDLIAQFERTTDLAALPVFSPDGETISLNEHGNTHEGRVMADQTVRVFESRTGRLLRELKDPNIFSNAMAISPNGELLATGTSRNQIFFWDATSGELQFSLQGPHVGANLLRLSFSPDGTRVAVNSSHETDVVQIWDLASSQMTHEFAVAATDFAFTPDGTKLVSGHDDGTALVWDLRSPHLPRGRELTRQEIETRWTELGYSYDSSRGNQGIHDRMDALVEGGDQTVAFFEEVLLDPDGPNHDEEQIQRLVEPLTDADPTVRERAVQEIIKFGDRPYLAVHGLEERPATEEEVKWAKDALVQCLNYRWNSHGSIDVLYQIATRRARELLRTLADGPEENQEQKNRKLMAKYRLDELEKSRIRGRD